jgi:hypothetical protein
VRRLSVVRQLRENSGNGCFEYVWLRTPHKQVLPLTHESKEQEWSRESEKAFFDRKYAVSGKIFPLTVRQPSGEFQ